MASQRKHFHSHSLTKRLHQLSNDRSHSDLKTLRAQIHSYDQQLRQLEADRSSLRSVSPALPPKRRSPLKAKFKAPRPKSTLPAGRNSRHRSQESLPLSQPSDRDTQVKEIQTSLPDADVSESFETFGTKQAPSQEAEVSRMADITEDDDSLQPYISYPQQLRKPKTATAPQELTSSLIEEEGTELLGYIPDQSSMVSQPQREEGVLRASFEQSLVYQDSLYREIERIKDLFEAEKKRWKQQVKRLKDEQQAELDTVKASYETQLRHTRESISKSHFSPSQDYCKLLDSSEKEKQELRLSLETQHQLSLDLQREQLRSQFQQELESYKQQLARKHDEEENFLQEQLLQRLQMNETRIRTQVQQELQEQFGREKAARDREYELILKARVNSLKGDYERKIKELQETVQGLRQGRTALEELEVSKAKENSQALCSKCGALLQVSEELMAKRSKLRSIVGA